MNVWAKLFFFCCVFTLPTLTINVSWSIITYISFITNVWSQRSKGFVSKTLEILRVWDVTELKAVEHDSIHESKNVLNNGCYFPDNNVSNAAWRKSSSTNWLIQTELASFFYIRRELRSKDAFEFLLVRTVKNASVQNHAATSNAYQGHNDSVHNVTSRSIYQQTWYRWAYWAEHKDLWLLTSLRMIHRPKNSWKIMVLL